MHKPTPSIPISIEELTSFKAREVFHGNDVTYKTILDKSQKENNIFLEKI